MEIFNRGEIRDGAGLVAISIPEAAGADSPCIPPFAKGE